MSTSLKMYEDATKEELIDRITQLERHVIQLKNVIAKSQVFYLSLFILLLLISSYDPYALSSFANVDKPQTVNPQKV